MSKKKISRIKHEAILEYWSNQGISELELNFDWGDGFDHCWNCGNVNSCSMAKRGYMLERCHIVPDALGGTNTPDNYVLLCKECHEEAPNITNKEAMWDWIKSNKVEFGFTGMYKIMKALQRLSLESNKPVLSLIDTTKDEKSIMDIIKDSKDLISTHGNKINESTHYYNFKNIIKRVDLLEDSNKDDRPRGCEMIMFFSATEEDMERLGLDKESSKHDEALGLELRGIIYDNKDRVWNYKVLNESVFLAAYSKLKKMLDVGRKRC